MSLAAEAASGYQLTIAPKSYYEIRGKLIQPSCVQCNEELEVLDRFDDIQGKIQTGFYYTGELQMCPECGHAHYIVDKTDHISGPVTLQWKS
jgi:hypothetical protein